MALQKLPNDIIQLISRSSTQIFSYKRAVEELVYNSLDARASSIAIRVDIDQHTIQVIDNGNGIPKQDFVLLGERYATSKYVNLSALKSAPDQYGYRGQSLASIKEVSKSLKITSRHETDDKTWLKLFTNNSISNISETIQRPSKGTTVEVKGFLYNHNIQKKTVNPAIEMHDIKIFLEKMALVHNNISLSLRDDTQNEIMFKLHKNRDLYQTLSSLFGIDKTDVQEYKVEKNQYKVTAFIGKTYNEISYHWIYLNGKYISESKLHKFINSNMKKSLNLNMAQKKVKSKINLNQDNEKMEKKLPYYFIFITCPYYDYDVIINTKKTAVEFKHWDQINKLLDKLIEFYTGNIKLKEIKVNNVIKPDHPVKNKEEVEKIIHKILGSNKKPNVSQLQNGVKGKLVKRKLKKVAPKLSLSKVIPIKKNNNIAKSNEKCSVNPVISLEIPDHVANNNVTKEGTPKAKKEKPKSETKLMFTKTHKNLMKTQSKFTEQGKATKAKIKNIQNIQKVAPKVSLSKVITIKKNNNFAKSNEKCSDNPVISLEIPDHIANNNVTKEGTPKAKKEKPKSKTKLMSTKTRKNLMKNQSKFTEQGKATKAKIKNVPQKLSLSKLKARRNHLNGIVKKFYDHSDTISKKCNMLSKQVETLINCKDVHKQRTVIYDTDKNCNIVENNNRSPVNYKEECDYEKVYNPNEPYNEICTFDNRVWKNKKTITKSTYDLIQTIIKSQQDTNANKYETLLSIQESGQRQYSKKLDSEGQRYCLEIKTLQNSIKEGVFPSHNDLGFKTTREYDFKQLTYESHNYNKNAMTTNSHSTYFSHFNYGPKANNFHFISEKSRDNFTIPKEHDNFQNKIRCNRKYFYSTKTPYSKKNEINKMKEVFRKNINQSSVTIDFTQSNYTKHDCPSIDKHCHKIATYSINSDTENTIRVSSQINSTYTIISNSFNTVHDSYDKPKKKVNSHRFDEQNELYPQHANDDSHIVERLFIDTENANEHDDKANAFLESEQDKDIEDENIEPLEVCQTIMLSHESNCNMEYRNKRNDSLFNDDFSIESVLCDRNIYTFRQQNTVSDNFVNTDNKIQERNLQDDEKVLKCNDNVASKTNEVNNQQITIYSNKMLAYDVVSSDANNFYFKNRLRFVPKGMSPIFQNCRTKNDCNYNLDEEYFEKDIYKNFINDVQTHAEVFEPVIQHVKEQTSRAIDKVNQKLNKDNASLKFDCESLRNVVVLGQVDHKFIGAKIESKSKTNIQQTFLVLFDQHAVHERIRLEKNLSDYLKGDQWKSIPLDLSLQLNKEDILYLHNYKEKFSQLGLQWTVSDCEVTISAIPEAILGKNPRPVEVIMKTVKKLISEEIQAIRTQKGCITLYPKAIMDLVFSEACRYAIKFGDKLSKSDCIELLKSLSECRTPFQCAHGRPVMAVLVNLNTEIRSYKTNAAKIQEFIKRKQRQ